MTPSDAFSLIYGGRPNFMTPHIVKIGKAGKFFYEISSGVRIFGEGNMFGVTIIDAVNLKRRHDLSTLFFSESEALEYVSSLRKRSKNGEI